MYRYMQVKTYDTICNYKKAQIKFSLPKLLMAIGIMDLMLMVAWIIISGLTNIKSLYALAVLIIFQVIILIVYYSKSLNDKVNYISDDEKKISFDEKGIEIIGEGSMQKISWKAIKKVKIYDEFMIMTSNLLNMPSYIFLFNSFDRDKHVIIEDIEKYKQVRRA